MTPAFVLLAVAVLLLGLGLVRGYRALARLDRQVRLAWAQVEAQYAGRRSLAQALLQDRAAPLAGSNGALKAVTEALALAAAARDPLARRQGEAELGSALKALVANADPRADGWRVRFASANHRIRMAQRFYHDQALVYNAKLSTMPLALAARAGGLRPAELTDGDDHGA